MSGESLARLPAAAPGAPSVPSEGGTRTGMDTTLIGPLLFIASEAMFFAGLFAAYFNVRARETVWPPEGIELDYPIAIVITAILLSSSVTMQLAVSAIKAGNHRRMMRYVIVTFVLGAIFLTGQLLDYATLNFGIGSGVYGALFYTLTGFHGAHVTGGLIAILVVLLRGSAGQFSARHHAMVEGVSAYWHFVDVIWVLLFSTLYLLR
jgi:cytochrome c oxidase subunit 3